MAGELNVKIDEKHQKPNQRSAGKRSTYEYEAPLNQFQIDFSQPQISSGEITQYTGLGNYRTYPSAIGNSLGYVSQPIEQSYLSPQISYQYASPQLTSGYAGIGHGSGLVVGSALTNGYYNNEVGTTYGNVLGGYGSTSRLYLPPSSDKIISPNLGQISYNTYGTSSYALPATIGTPYHQNRPLALTSSIHTPNDFRPSVFLGSSIVPSSTPTYAEPSRQYLPAAAGTYSNYNAH